MPEIAAADPMAAGDLARYAEDGRSWVAVDPAGTVVGYVVVDVVDGNAHVEQLSVAPSHQGAGVGRALLDRVGAWAAAGGRPALTLTTFRDVPWNAPLYRHLGFRDLDEPEIGPELAAVREHEATLGLDPALRTCMRRPVRPG
jgi:GNAT superfamily N-acetyltransferase